MTAVNRDGQSRSAEVIVPTPANELRALLERAVLKFEDRYPWLSEVWTRINRPDFSAEDSRCPGSSVGCASYNMISITGIRVYFDRRLDPRRRQSLESSLEQILVHEMAYVYHSLTDLAVNPAAIAAGWMYIKDLVKDSVGCPPIGELSADGPLILMDADGLISFTGNYWVACPPSDWGSPYNDNSRQELLAVMRSVYVDQEVPQWFYDTYQRADGTWDVEAIKVALGFYDPDSRTYWQLRQLIPDL